MPIPESYSFIRYLESKKTVDDRALNRLVWDSLAKALDRIGSMTTLRVLEAGAGTGAMLERMLDRRLLRQARYTGIDLEPENVAHARQRIPDWATSAGFQVEDTPEGQLSLERPIQKVVVEFQTGDILKFAAQEKNQTAWDLIIAHAFLDLTNIPQDLPRLFLLLRTGGLLYMTVNFDGLTIFEPALDPTLDNLIMDLYHKTMDNRLVNGSLSGDSQAGRHLFTHIRKAGGRILAAGSSDWVVYPISRSYPAEEAYFLHYIIHTIQSALEGNPELEGKHFSEWITARHVQVERAELVYIAHQLDFLCII